MAGVAGPMLGRSKPQGARFLSGLLVGGAAASLLLATALFGVGTLLERFVPGHIRLAAAAVALAVLGAADLAGRTPHVWRQVPVVHLRTLSPGRLGLVWGFDLSLLFTTQKSTSLTWAVLAGIGLLDPSSSWPVLVAMTAVGVLTIAVRSVLYSIGPLPAQGDRSRPWFARMRRACGAALVVLAALISVWRW